VDSMVHYYPELTDNIQIIGINPQFMKGVCGYPKLSFPILQDNLKKNFDDHWTELGCTKDDFLFYDKHGNLVKRVSHMEDNMTDFGNAGIIHDAAFQAIGVKNSGVPEADKKEYGLDRINKKKKEQYEEAMYGGGHNYDLEYEEKIA